MKSFEEIYDEKGGYITDKSYTEIIKLCEMLEKANIPHTFEKWQDGYRICYPKHISTGKCICDAIETFGSYGNEQNLLEIQGLLTKEEGNDVLGWLTAENVFERMKKHYLGVED